MSYSPIYTKQEAGWKNIVRNRLSRSPWFFKEKQPTDGLKSCLWGITLEGLSHFSQKLVCDLTPAAWDRCAVPNIIVSLEQSPLNSGAMQLFPLPTTPKSSASHHNGANSIAEDPIGGIIPWFQESPSSFTYGDEGLSPSRYKKSSDQEAWRTVDPRWLQNTLSGRAEEYIRHVRLSRKPFSRSRPNRLVALAAVSEAKKEGTGTGGSRLPVSASTQLHEHRETVEQMLQMSSAYGNDVEPPPSTLTPDDELSGYSVHWDPFHAVGDVLDDIFLDDYSPTIAVV